MLILTNQTIKLTPQRVFQSPGEHSREDDKTNKTALSFLYTGHVTEKSYWKLRKV